ncbi:DUF364 domain-containing protein [Lachnospiraceae bacterium 54-53]
MWELYDSLIEPIPDDIKVEDYFAGIQWTSVTAGGYTGAAATNPLQTMPMVEKYIGDMSWKEAAGLIRSWNFTEASIGAAAVNAFYNQQNRIRRLEQEGTVRQLSGEDAFLAHKDDIKGKKVATIGHFCFSEKYLKEAGSCVILERNPMDGDYPDSACEYVLQDMDYVFITGFTLVNKTLPRLLELSRNARVILVGPSAALAPRLFDFGLWEIAGTVITDTKRTKELVKKGEHKAVIRSGLPVRIAGK